MESQEKNKQLYIDKEAISVLNLAKEGLLYPVQELMNKKQMLEVNASGMFANQSYPCPFLLSPSGKRNKEVLSKAKKGESIEIEPREIEIYGEIPGRHPRLRHPPWPDARPRPPGTADPLCPG